MAMLDIFFLPFMLGFFLLYLYRNYFLSGVFVGLAAVAKLFAAMATPTVFIHWLFSRTKPSRWFIATMVMAPVSFIAFIPLFDFAITHQIHNPISRIKEMLSLSGSLTFANTTHPALSRPWDWLLSPVSGTAYWYGPFSTNWVGGYTGVVSPTVWGLMIPVVLYLIYRAVKRDDAGLFASAWFFGTFLLWIPISIITDRVSFAYYFYPTVGALCIGLGLAINQIMGWVQAKRLRIKIPVYSGLGVYFLAHIASLVVLTPLLLLIMGK
jgi:predicted membrane-bound dolichyl-phosphate-mannose-protein mannosyltransferase